MLFSTIAGTISVISCVNTILIMTAYWLTTFGNSMSNIMAGVLSLATIVLTYHMILHIREKIKGTKLDNKLKRITLEDKLNK